MACAAGPNASNGTELLQRSPSLIGTTGIVGVRPEGPTGDSVVTHADNAYDGGGWLMVLNNRTDTNGMKDVTYDDAINKVCSRTTVSSAYRTDGIKKSYTLSDFNILVGLKYWPYMGKRIAQFVSTTPISPSGSPTKLAQWSYAGFDSNYGFQGVGSLNIISGDTPGFYSYHAANGYGFTTLDVDHDTNGGNCSTYYNNTPWWYGSCWSGSYYGGGGGGGYTDNPYWVGSSSDYHSYGAVYVK